MSGFKRMQSKVFWGHMASQDCENAPLLYSNNCDTTPNKFQNSYCNFGHDSDTDNTKTSNDSLQNIDITAINVQEFEDQRRSIYNHGLVNIHVSQDESQREDHEDPSVNDKKCDKSVEVTTEYQNCVQNIPRPFSPLDHGHGSLDSGFSDSERPKSPQVPSDTDSGITKRRKKFRRRSQDRRDTVRMNIYQSRLNNTLWRENELPSCPSHTSTPKRNFQSFNGRHNFTCDKEHVRVLNEDVRTDNRIEEEQVDTAAEIPPGFNHVSDKEECLDDFLYENEPPEDDDIPTTSSCSTSRDSTPSFPGPWYSRISTESSSKSSSRSTERSQRFILEEKVYSSVKMWLNDLLQDVDDDSCITLQSKALPKRKVLYYINQEEQTKDIKMMTAKATAAATELLVRADTFMKNIEDIVLQISHLDCGRSPRELLRRIEEQAFSILSELGGPPPRRIHDGSFHSILSQIESLNNMVNSIIDNRLDFYIEEVVRGLEDAPREDGSVARGALAALTALGLAGTRAGNSIARCSGVRAMLTSLISASRLSSELRASTLRALASVCCCPLAIHCFVKEGGPEILMDLLISKNTPESEKMEATALVVQITAPWIHALGLCHLEPFADILVKVLIRLAEETACGQTLLLCSAAMNNLADSKVFTQIIIQQDGVRRLLRCVKQTPGGNIWLMEQVASLINKLAKDPEIRIYLAKIRASVALVSFLRMAPPGLEDAYQRLSMTAATALTRLCVDEEIARQVVAVGGADCLPNRLTYDENDDNNEKVGLLKYSKSLRVACKKAAKRIDDAKASDYSI